MQATDRGSCLQWSLKDSSSHSRRVGAPGDGLSSLHQPRACSRLTRIGPVWELDLPLIRTMSFKACALVKVLFASFGAILISRNPAQGCLSRLTTDLQGSVAAPVFNLKTSGQQKPRLEEITLG